MIIHDSDINEAALIGIKSLSDLKELKIFSHLPNEDEANGDLWEAIHKEPEPEPVLWASTGNGND